jgi:PAS domain S-box-containing protein
MEDEDKRWSMLKKAINDLRKRLKKYETTTDEYDQPGEYILKYKEHLEDLIREQSKYHTQTKEIIRFSDDKYYKLFEVAPESIVILDIDGEIIDCNEQTLRLVGIDKKKIIGKSFSNLGIINKKELDKYIEIFTSLSNINELNPIEIPIKGADGNEQWLEVFPSPIKNGKKVYGIQIITRDITSRKKSEKALKESERKYKLIIDNISDNVWITNMILQTTYSSPAVKQILGYSPKEIKSKSITDILLPKSLIIVANALKEELKNEGKKGVDPNRTHILELQMKHKSGTIIWAELKMTFLRNSKGNPIGILGVTRDITKRKQVELKHKQSEIKYQRLIENIMGVVVELDSEGNFIFVSPQIYETFGFTSDEVIKKNAFEFIHPDDLEIVAMTLLQALTENKDIMYPSQLMVEWSKMMVKQN